MTLTDVASLGIVATAVSMLVQYLKVKFGTSGYKTNAILIGLSILVGIVYFFLQSHVNWLEAAASVLVVANAIYSFFIKPLENNTPAAPTN